MKQKEGYLLIDNRNTGEGLLEAATTTCSHCQRQVVRNPSRIRERAYCPKCDHYICDECEAARVITGVCRTFSEVLDILDTKIARNENLGNPQTLIARLSQ